jgi:hypothetical protein
VVVRATLSLFAGAATGVSHPEHDHLPTARLAGIRWSVEVRAAQNNRLGPAPQLYRGGVDRLGTAFAH